MQLPSIAKIGTTACLLPAMLGQDQSSAMGFIQPLRQPPMPLRNAFGGQGVSSLRQTADQKPMWPGVRPGVAPLSMARQEHQPDQSPMANALATFFKPLEWLAQVAQGRSQVSDQEHPVVTTGLLVAGLKLAADVLKNDPITEKLVGPHLLCAMKLLVQSVGPQFFKEFAIVSRTPWIDTRLQDIIQDKGIEQLVVLGAGLDARPYRLDSLENVDVFELDLPESVGAKERLFQDTFEKEGECILPTSRKLQRIGIDLKDPQWQEQLKASGFDPEKPSIFLAEGLVYYFAESEAVTLMSQVKDMSAPGSHVLFDGLNSASADASAADKMFGKPGLFQFGHDYPENWLQDIGFNDCTVLQPGEPGADEGFDHAEADKKGFHRMLLNSFDRYAYQLPRDQQAPDGKPVRRFFFVEGQVK